MDSGLPRRCAPRKDDLISVALAVLNITPCFSVASDASPFAVGRPDLAVCNNHTQGAVPLIGMAKELLA
jgi:hypothetical protein